VGDDVGDGDEVGGDASSEGGLAPCARACARGGPGEGEHAKSPIKATHAPTDALRV
jgi:hypothetical protein